MLSIVSTPIGNLGDITLRALATLKTCDAIICEDTRVTGQLLKLLNLPKKNLISCHGYSDEGKIAMILQRLKRNEHLVLVSDAGTPGISRSRCLSRSPLCFGTADQSICVSGISAAEERNADAAQVIYQRGTDDRLL